MQELTPGHGLTAPPSVYEVGGQRFEAASRGFAEAVADAHAAHHRPRCMCLVDGVEMYVARLAGSNKGFIVKRMVWLEASVRGVKTLGYEPNPADLEVLKKEREARLVNRIEPDRLGRDDSTGTAAAPADKASARGGGGRKAVLVAIEAVLVAKGVPEKQRAAVMAAATEKLAQRIRDGQAPKVKVYDKAAPSQRPAVMPTPEVQRTRERAAPVR